MSDQIAEERLQGVRVVVEQLAFVMAGLRGQLRSMNAQASRTLGDAEMLVAQLESLVEEPDPAVRRFRLDDGEFLASRWPGL